MVYDTRRYNWECGTIIYYVFGLPCSLLGFTLSLVAAFLDKCKCCNCCCCSPCSASYQFGALRVDLPHTPYILGPGGELVMEGVDDTEEKKEGKVEMEEFRGGHGCQNEALNL